MKATDYINKYRLNETKHFSHADLVKDLENDFQNKLHQHEEKGELDYTNFRSVVNETRSTLDEIIGQAALEAPRWENLWRYFYATVVCKVRDKLFDEGEAE